MHSFLKVITLTIIICHNLIAQELAPITFQRHFLSLGIGPSFATGKLPVQTTEQRSNGTETFRYNDVGHGKGLSFLLGYTFMLNRALGIEFDVTRLIGGNVSLNNTYYNYDPLNSYSLNQTNNYKASIWKFNLLLCGRLPYRNIVPYYKTGVVISAGNKLKRQISEKVTFAQGGTQKGEIEIMNTGGVSYGFNAVIGIDIPVSSRTIFFTEINYTALNHKWEKWETTKFELDGKDQLKTLPANQKMGTYADVQPSSKSGSLTFKTSLSSISIMVGLRIALQKINI